MAVLKGEVKFSSFTINVALPQVEAGTVRALAVASARTLLWNARCANRRRGGLVGV